MVLVSPRICPDTTETAPNSPMARAVQRMTPDIRLHLMLGRVTRKESLPAARAQNESGFLFIASLRLHVRNQFARDKGNSHENGRQNDSRNREDDVDVVIRQPRSKPALRAEDQNKDQSRDHGRNRKWKIEQRDQKILAAKIELRNGPRRSNAKESIEGNGEGCGNQCQTNGGRVYPAHVSLPNSQPSFFESLNENGDQRRYQKHREKQQSCKAIRIHQ